jgi:hypothetical protein
MLMSPGFPITISPSIVAELWRVLKLLFRDVGAEATLDLS